MSDGGLSGIEQTVLYEPGYSVADTGQLLLLNASGV
jgi:hypothetical protein